MAPKSIGMSQVAQIFGRITKKNTRLIQKLLQDSSNQLIQKL